MQNCCGQRCPGQRPIPIPPRTILPVSNSNQEDALYAVGSSCELNNNDTLPLTLQTKTPFSSLSVSNDSVILPAGIYSVSFGATWAGNQEENDDAGTEAASASQSFAMQLYANGSPVPGETITAPCSFSTSISKTILYSAQSSTALSLYNVSGVSVEILNGYITILKIA